MKITRPTQIEASKLEAGMTVYSVPGAFLYKGTREIVSVVAESPIALCLTLTGERGTFKYVVATTETVSVVL